MEQGQGQKQGQGAPAVIRNIQALRFVAAFWVVIHHTLPPNVHPAHYANIPHFFTVLSQYGFAGVDIFFVISGYIMAQTTQVGATGLKAGSEFVLRRYLRIYTGYWPVFLLVLAMSVAWGIWQEPEISPWASFWLLPQQRYLLNVAWTLTYELYFYLLLGVLIVFTRAQVTRIMLALFVALAVYVLVQHQRGFYVPGQAQWHVVRDMLLTSPLILEFMAGFLLQRHLCGRSPAHADSPFDARTGLRHAPRRFALWFWLVFTAAALALSVSVQTWGGLQGVGMAAFLYYPERALLFGSAAVGLVALAVLLPEASSWPARVMQALGDASYALYLLHIPWLTLLYGKLYPHLGRLLWVGGGKLSLLMYLCTVVLASLAYFRWVESPLHRASRRWVQRLLSR